MPPYLCAVRLLWKWLQELVEITESPEAFADRLTCAGLEVESLTPYRRLTEVFQDIRIGLITHIEKHPKADKLWITQVSLGTGKPYMIVTGANNIRVGDKVPVALPGVTLPTPKGPLTIAARAFRGVESEGMLCSQWELGYGEDAEGIWILPAYASVGLSLQALLGDYEDLILEVSATPNRGDALSHWGVAREYAALTGARLASPPQVEATPTVPFPYQLQVPNPEAVPRYGGIYMENLSVAETPTWMRFRLEALGLRPIHPIVDVTNYILIGYGQPLHAFDADKVQGDTLWIGPWRGAEPFETLGGKTLELKEGDVVIADGAGPACLGGLIGGLRTAVSETTNRIFLESAYFSPERLRRTSRRLHLVTESGYRFVRGADPQMVPWAAHYAAALLREISPELRFSAFSEVHESSQTAPRVFSIHLPTLRQLTALPLSGKEVETLLSRLDIRMEGRDVDETWRIAVPRYRLDVTRPADIAEELVRLVGWQNLPRLSHPEPFAYQVPSPLDRRFELKEAISEFLTGLGLWEIRTNSLTRRAAHPPHLSFEPIRLHNPLYEEVAYLRTTLASALEVVAYNRNHGAPGFWAYEWGRVYLPSGEAQRLALWGWGRSPRYGLSQPALWEDFLGVVESLLERIRLPYRLEPFYHPEPGLWIEGARIWHERQLIGTAGLLHPTYRAWAQMAESPVAFAELDAEVLLSTPPRLPLRYQPLSLFPIVVKDLSFYVPSGVSYEALTAAIRQALAGEGLLLRIEPFDRYQDPEKGQSYGIRLYLQAPDRTLEETTIHQLLNRAIAALEAIGAQVRKAPPR